MQLGIKVGCFFAICFIGEAKNDIQETITYAYKVRQLSAESFVFSIATLVYGNRLYEQAKSTAFLIACFSDCALTGAELFIETPEFTAEELRELCAQANLVNPVFTRDKILRLLETHGKH